MSAATSVWQIAIPAPLYRLFDYLAPRSATDPPQPGARVRVPFGRGHRIGVITGAAATSRIESARLKRVSEVLDDPPLLPAELMRLLRWTADYYHAPPGEVIAGALPTLLRRGEPAHHRSERRWRLSAAGRAVDVETLARAPRRQQLLRLLAARADDGGLGAGDIAAMPGARAALRALHDQGWVVAEDRTVDGGRTGDTTPDVATMPGPGLNPAQRQAIETVTAAAHGFQAYLLDGVTGSGKTEVYFGVITAMLHKRHQILLLVPEIGLTPQLVDRVRERFRCPLSVLHSGLGERERLDAWLRAQRGEARIVIGTRSAVLTPLPALGAIIVDEEHDGSYKQQDGVRYHARDLALVRARALDIPVILGSATPSLESLHNCKQGRYHPLALPTRAGAAVRPAIRLVDMRTQPIENGLSEVLASAIDRHLAQDRQVLLFLNRRGYAPTLLCQECGWVADCHRCDAHMILHQRRGLLRCHHCDTQGPIPLHCPGCGNHDLRPLGQGTERVEETLTRRFEQAEILRIDRDSTRGKGTMSALMQRIRDGRRQILIGTQMLAKGHHFPNVTLAGILDIDFGLFGADFRAGERMGQLIVQVAGRAGRAEQPGEVLIQTRYPEHPLLSALLEHDYRHFAERLLEERVEAGMPPARYMALLRAESVQREAPMAFLQRARQRAETLVGMPAKTPNSTGVDLLGPAPAPMERRAGRYRAQLMLLADQRAPLHRLLSGLMPELDTLSLAGKVRWSLDVDPIDES